MMSYYNNGENVMNIKQQITEDLKKDNKIELLKDRPCLELYIKQTYKRMDGANANRLAFEIVKGNC